ncbi:heme ABC transporter ATP-binding protein [Shewanella algae]|uniref:heme ABC transporter ATP-binding protein n=1 Tax=Shewanella algae TaxID=38313 RepID=UPI0031F5053D
MPSLESVTATAAAQTPAISFESTAVTEQVLELKHLHARVDNKPLLTDVSCRLQSGQFYALLGPNGAGKSSLLRLLTQELKADAGRISLHGSPLGQWPKQDLARHLAMLPQHSSLSFPFSVREVVAMGLYPLSLSARDAAQLVEQQLWRLDLAHLSERSYPALSGGERQRVQLARVLTQLAQAEHSPVLLLDEPTSALDLAQQHRVLRLARELAHEQDYTVLAVLHDLNQASHYADQLLVMDKGKLLVQGEPQQALTPELVSRVWHYEPGTFADAQGQRLYF